MDVEVFLNYGIAGLILFVFYMLFKNELHSLREAIGELKDTIAGLREAVSANTKVLEIVLEEVKRREGKAD